MNEARLKTITSFVERIDKVRSALGDFITEELDEIADLEGDKDEDEIDARNEQVTKLEDALTHLDDAVEELNNVE